MKTLKTEFDKRGFHYKQIWRDEGYAIYSQTKYRTHYEVIRIRIAKDYELGGVQIEGGEMYPGDNKWGVDGFTVFTKERAFAKVEEIKRHSQEIAAKNNKK